MIDLYDKGVATYIEDENEAFDKLAEQTKLAKTSLRTSRFAPQAISGTKKDFLMLCAHLGKNQGLLVRESCA